MKIKKNKLINKNKGFTIIETLVSLTLFTIVVVILGGVIVSVIDINKKNQTISNVVNNLNYSIDSMIRDIKTGYAYTCQDLTYFTTTELLKVNNSEQCPKSSQITLISTISGKEVVVRYEFVDGDEDSNNYIKKTTYNSEGGEISNYSITDISNVNIENLRFKMVVDYSPLSCTSENGSTCNYGQPNVFVLIKGSAGDKDLESSKFFVQTFISQRKLNLSY